MKNQNAKLMAYGAEIQVNPNGCVYVTINGTTVYFENCYWENIRSTTPIINVWNENSPEDSAIDLTEYIILNT
jgi:hypothetical protein